jgi:hypothetical protein
MKEADFIKLIERVNKLTLITRSELEPEVINEINNIRCSYKILKKELDYKRLYPPHELDLARRAYKEVKDYCNVVKMKDNININNLKDCNGIYIRFYYKDYDITNIIDISI